MTDQPIYLPELLFTGAHFERGMALRCGPDGLIDAVEQRNHSHAGGLELKGKALLPGMINAHSHAFQRVIRGRTEHASGLSTDSFWTWREAMYAAALRLNPDDLYAAARMAFLEMARSGITSVAEFHYLHKDAEGRDYADRGVMAAALVEAARALGIRLTILRCAYLRSGFKLEPDPLQLRFVDQTVAAYLERVQDLLDYCKQIGGNGLSVGVAPHSMRAVPLDHLHTIKQFAESHDLPIHMHVAEQPAEVAACMAEYKSPPIQLLAAEGILSTRFTAVHAIHITNEEVAALARSGATICACPTTERNLGDGIVPADLLFAARVPVSLGSDSNIQIDLLEDARELEYHMRITKLQRNVLTGSATNASDAAALLFGCATSAGARSLRAPVGTIAPGMAADFFTVDLNEPALAGAADDTLLAHLLYSASSNAVCDTIVAGKFAIKDRNHPEQTEIVREFQALQRRIWA